MKNIRFRKAVVHAYELDELNEIPDDWFAEVYWN